MPRVNRSEICDPEQIQVFHLINRCVRKTFLCGKDRKSGRDYSHRKEWIRQRLEELAGIFAVEILGFAVLSNHLHVVVRTRPDLAEHWSHDEISVRWWHLFPQRRNSDGSPAQPTEEELNAIRNNTSGLNEKKRRLAHISWFMRCLAEPIARRGNKDDNVTGRFWAGRFKSQVLLDEIAIAACMAYVDLNPIRAGVATTPETSNFTSVKERIQDRQSAQELTSPEEKDLQTEHGKKAGWLSPIALEPGTKDVRNTPNARRASNKGCLFMTLEQYLLLLDWTGRQMKKGKLGHVPQEFAPILERLDCDAELWMLYVRDFRRVFRNEAGKAENRKAFRSQRNRNRAQAVTA
jgi:REP element-mobilizing transposase RayT